jgi:hypothetical protein
MVNMRILLKSSTKFGWVGLVIPIKMQTHMLTHFEVHILEFDLLINFIATKCLRTRISIAAIFGMVKYNQPFVPIKNRTG